ncbi:MAG: hypothetical protein FWD15_01180 [Alphaproteobacteria bacterium]|nr:hypothetical protein [Alphaproteobacteria bacterium]
MTEVYGQPQISDLLKDIQYNRVKFAIVNGNYSILNSLDRTRAYIERRTGHYLVWVDGHIFTDKEKEGQFLYNTIMTKCLADKNILKAEHKDPFRGEVCRLAVGYHTHNRKPVAYYTSFQR